MEAREVERGVLDPGRREEPLVEADELLVRSRKQLGLCDPERPGQHEGIPLEQLEQAARDRTVARAGAGEAGARRVGEAGLAGEDDVAEVDQLRRQPRRLSRGEVDALDPAEARLAGRPGEGEAPLPVLALCERRERLEWNGVRTELGRRRQDEPVGGNRARRVALDGLADRGRGSLRGRQPSAAEPGRVTEIGSDRLEAVGELAAEPREAGLVRARHALLEHRHEPDVRVGERAHGLRKLGEDAHATASCQGAAGARPATGEQTGQRGTRRTSRRDTVGDGSSVTVASTPGTEGSAAASQRSVRSAASAATRAARIGGGSAATGVEASRA